MDTTGCFIGTDGMWIETASGVAFPVVDIQPDLIDIEDIAHALSLTCRFAGHCKRFYSVAEHTVAVYRTMNGMGASKNAMRCALLHDASEAYLGDVTRPLKAALPEYRKIEHRLQEAIYEAFGAIPTEDERSLIKCVDNMVLRKEAKELMFSAGHMWDFGDIEPSWIEPQCWSPEQAKAEFLFRWNGRSCLTYPPK